MKTVGWNENRWNLEEDHWAKRAKKMLDIIANYDCIDDMSLMDLGAGGQHIKKLLNFSGGGQYYPVDYIKRDYVESVIIRDFNRYEFFEHNVDIMFASGILEYIKDWKWFIGNICKYCEKYVVIAYNTLSDSASDAELNDRREKGWISDISEKMLLTEFALNGFTLCEMKKPYDGGSCYPESYYLFVRETVILENLIV